MPINVQVTRLGRVRQRVRTDLWPDPPMLPDSICERFPELRKFNEDMKLWSERVKNAWEFEPETTTEVCPD